MATSKNYGKKKVRITSGIFWTLMGKNPIMEKSDAGAACLSWTFFFPEFSRLPYIYSFCNLYLIIHCRLAVWTVSLQRSTPRSDDFGGFSAPTTCASPSPSPSPQKQQKNEALRIWGAWFNEPNRFLNVEICWNHMKSHIKGWELTKSTKVTIKICIGCWIHWVKSQNKLKESPLQSRENKLAGCQSRPLKWGRNLSRAPSFDVHHQLHLNFKPGSPMKWAVELSQKTTTPMGWEAVIPPHSNISKSWRNLSQQITSYHQMHHW